MNSVCIATYNGEKYIHEQLASILSQINIDDEVIISDDNSTDNTIQIINNFNDPRIKLIKGGFRNFTFNFENAIKHAKGDYIFLSDQDDVWLPNKYTTTLHALKSFDLVCSDAIVVNQNLSPIHSSFFEYYNSGKGILKNIIKCSYCGACIAFNKKILHAIQPFPNTAIFMLLKIHDFSRLDCGKEIGGTNLIFCQVRKILWDICEKKIFLLKFYL